MRDYIKPEIKKIDGESFIKVSDVLQIIETHAANMNERASETGLNNSMIYAYNLAHENLIGFFEPFKN